MHHDAPDELVAFIELIRTELGIDEALTPGTPLITSGLIDSFDVVSLIAIIESHYRVTVIPEELDTEIFDTPRQMLAYIQGFD